jgi:hypothetical protein
LINKGFTLWTNKESEDWYEKNGEEAVFYYSAGSYYLGISETKIKNYTSSGEFVSTSLQRRQAVLWYADSIDNATGLKLDLSTTTNDYSLKLSVDNGKVSISDGNNSVTQSYNLAQFNNQPLLVGTGSTSTEGNNFYGLYGKFNKLEFFDSDSENVKVINATSSLVIDLSNPKVVEYWPNCIEACINTQIGVSFNMLMVTSTYKEFGAVELYECNNEEKCVCVDENCDSSFLKLLPISVGDDSDPNILKFYPAANGY